ncbi:MAG: OB-fold domain-containing protein [bacterium]
MAGIVAYGSYVPRYRLAREVIAKEWGHASMGGEKAVAGHDEDSLTLAINAALHALPEGGAGLDAIYFATTTPPYREKQSATTVAAVLDAAADVRTADFTDSLRAGTSALRAALDTVHAGARRTLVCAGDCRMGEPDTPAEQSYGDAGAALVIGGDADAVIAEVVGSYGVSEEIIGTWRADEHEFLHAFPGAFETKVAYTPFVLAAVQGLLKATGTAPESIAKLVLAAPNPRAVAGVAKALKIDAKKQLQDTLWTLLGDVGTTQPLLLLTAALEQAKPGDLILAVSYGDGADAVLLRATEKLAQYRTTTSLFSQVERKRLLPSYGKYARFRRLIKTETRSDDLSTPVVLFRDRRTVLSLHGGKCPHCATVQFPRHQVCIECGHRDGLDEVKLARRGTLFTFTNDYLHDSPDAPTTHGVVELDGGARVYLQLTDVDAEQVEVDMPVELTFRKYHEGGGIQNYFWKARPAA